MAILQYEYLEDERTIRIDNDISYMYQFPDLTEHVIFLHEMIHIAFNKELIHEIFYVLTFDSLKKAINDLFDIGERQLSLLVNLLIHNNGKFSERKKKYVLKHFKPSEMDVMEEMASTAIQTMDTFRKKIAAKDKAEVS